MLQKHAPCVSHHECRFHDSSGNYATAQTPLSKADLPIVDGKATDCMVCEPIGGVDKCQQKTRGHGGICGVGNVGGVADTGHKLH